MSVYRDWTGAGGRVRQFRVYSYWTPPGDAWKAWVILLYDADAAFPDGLVTVELKLDRLDLPRSKLSPLYAIDQLPPYGLATSRRVGERDYDIGLAPAECPWPGGGSISVAEPHARRYFRSAESFRSAAIADLDRLEEALRAGVASGMAVAEYPPDQIEWTASGKPIRRPGRDGRPTRPGRGLPEAVKAEALGELVERLDHHRLLIREHSKDMHEALRCAFPLHDVFADPAGK